MNFQLFANTTLSLPTAFVLGGLIGLERHWRQRTAGLRTNVLVSVGAAAFVDLGLRVRAADGAVRVISSVVSDIGLLGGVVMKKGTQVRGINTAATLHKPISQASTEALYFIHVTCQPDLVAEAREVLHEEL